MEKCVVDRCEHLTHRKVDQYCSTHYWRFKKYGTPELPPKENRRAHPFYHLWFDRKGCRVKEWDELSQFIADISPKPDGDYFLVRLRDDVWGPTNFKWQPHLKRREGEANKNWWARKRQARLANIPAMDRTRDLKRRFGLTPDDYQAMMSAHNGVCAICAKPETAFDPKAGTRKSLAIDHCHASGKIRGLLCWRCNGTLGKIEDDISLLKAMIAYLEKHA